MITLRSVDQTLTGRFESDSKAARRRHPGKWIRHTLCQRPSVMRGQAAATIWRNVGIG